MGAEGAALRAVCLMGPTAAGKTAVAIELAKAFPVEIISVDSALVYRGMDIGTAKPTAAERAAAPHRLIDIREPHESYSAGEFCRDAVQAMREITAAGRVPLLVGGTMLYFHALQRGLARLPAAEPTLRAELDARAGREGWPALHAELQRLDPVTAARLKPTDAQRIQRALEVCLTTGEPLSVLQADTRPLVSAEYLNIGLLPSDRQALHRRIRSRLQAMVDAGFVAEVASLLHRPGVTPDAPSLRAVGYRQLLRHVRGELTLDEAIEQAVVATRRLAKRQITWLRGWPDLQPVDSLADGVVRQTVAQVKNWLRGVPA